MKTYKKPVQLRERERAGGRKSLYLTIRIAGQRKDEYLDLFIEPGEDRETKARNKETYRIAEAMAAKRLLEVEQGQYGDIVAKKTAYNIIELFDMILESRADDISTGTVETWATARRHLLNYMQGKPIAVAKITSQFVEGFKEYLAMTPGLVREGRGTEARWIAKGQPLSQNVRANYFAKLKTVLAEAFKRKLITQDFAHQVDNFTRQEIERSYLTQEELQAMVSTVCSSAIVKRAFLFGCFTGLRISDIRALQWGQVFDERGMTRLKFKQTKTGGQMYLDINDQAAALMGTRKGPEALVFDGLPSAGPVNTAVKRWAAAAGVAKEVTFHTSRHTFATLMLSVGTDIYMVSQLLGHKDIKTTEIYAKIIDDEKQRAVKNLPKFFK